MKIPVLKYLAAGLFFFGLNSNLFAQLSFAPVANYDVGNGHLLVVAADVNGDGKTDLISEDQGAQTLVVLTNNGNGIFGSNVTLNVGALNCFTTADVNGDSKIDLVSVESGHYNSTAGAITVFTNDGVGGFELKSKTDLYPPFIPVVSVVAADVDEDNKVDLIFADAHGNGVTVLTNDGSGGFATKALISVSFLAHPNPNPFAVVAADVNGDSKVDLVSVNSGNGTLTVLTNNGTGTFGFFSSPIVGTTPISGVAVDVNGDGKVDLISANNGDNSLTVLTNNGIGDLVLSSSPIVGSLPYSVTAGDVNADGKTDLICANYSGNSLTVLTNNGSGSFVLATTLVVGRNPSTVVAADLDGDGRLDLVSANSGTNTLSVLINTHPPSISSQPLPQIITAGSSLNLEVLADGTAPLVYQWHNNAGAIVGQTNSSLILNPAQTNHTDNYFVVITNSIGVVTSQVASVVVYLPVNIQAQPQSLAVSASAPTSFTVTASGFPAPTSYQWTHSGTNLPGANSSSFTISHVRLSDLGDYQVLVGNGYSSTNSDIAVLNMIPSITTPFGGAIALWGTDTTIAVGAIGSGDLNYQWFQDGVAIDGATNAMLNFTSIQFTNSGLYSVVVSSPFGTITNIAAQVVINPAGVSLGFCPVLTITGVVGYSYIIQNSTNLADTNAWITLTNLILTQPVQLWVDTNVDASSPFNSKYFYRVLPGQ